MWKTMLQSLLAPRYPRRYVGRHRMRFTIRLLFSASACAQPDGVPAAPDGAG